MRLTASLNLPHSISRSFTDIISTVPAVDKTCLIPSPTPLTSYDSIDLFEELLTNLVAAASPGPMPDYPSHISGPARTSNQSLSSRAPSAADLRRSVGSDRRESATERKASNTSSASLDGAKEEEHPSEDVGVAGAPAGPVPQRLVFLWDCFKRHYLKLLFPRVSRRVGMEVKDGEGWSFTRLDHEPHEG